MPGPFASTRLAREAMPSSVPYRLTRVGADVDQAEARVPALAVDVRIEPRVASDREQVLSRDVEPGRDGPRNEPRRQLVAKRERLEPQVGAVLHERVVEEPRPIPIRARDIGVDVRRRPAV